MLKLLSKESFQEIRVWIHRNARPLEMSLWNYYYEKGSAEQVVNALVYYQNEDGGFAGQVEADSWSPESSPYATMTAINILEKIGFFETAEKANPILQGIFRFLDSGLHADEEGWMFSIPSNDHYPHAPWWTYNEAENKIQNPGITVNLCAFIFRHGDRESDLFQKAVRYAKQILDKVSTQNDFGEMGAGGISMLLSVIKESSLKEELAYDGLEEKMKAVINKTIERDPEQWQYYRPRPSRFIASPDSPLYQGNEEIVAAELDYLIDTRKPGGVWEIPWSWFNLGEKYAKEFAISENWWKSTVAMEHIQFLKSFGRVE